MELYGSSSNCNESTYYLSTLQIECLRMCVCIFIAHRFGVQWIALETSSSWNILLLPLYALVCVRAPNSPVIVRHCVCEHLKATWGETLQNDLFTWVVANCPLSLTVRYGNCWQPCNNWSVKKCGPGASGFNTVLAFFSWRHPDDRYQRASQEWEQWRVSNWKCDSFARFLALYCHASHGDWYRCLGRSFHCWFPFSILSTLPSLLCLLSTG